MKKSFFLLSFILTSFHLCSQTDISGYISKENTIEKNTRINLVQVKGVDSDFKDSTKIIASSSIDDNGYFHFNQNLSNQSRFYYLSIGEKINIIRSKKILLANEDSLFFDRTTPSLSKYTNTNLEDKEWRKLELFQKKIAKKKKYLDEIRAYSKDSLQILAVKLISLKTLEKKHLLDKDIALNKNYYTLLLKEFQKSDINPEEYLFFELKLAKFQIQRVEENYMISKSVNFILLFLVLGILLFMYRSKNSKEELVVLSKQELAVRDLILQQKSNKEIASELFISVSTVKTNITNLYKKLQVVNRSELLLKFKNSTGTST